MQPEVFHRFSQEQEKSQKDHDWENREEILGSPEADGQEESSASGPHRKHLPGL